MIRSTKYLKYVLLIVIMMNCNSDKQNKPEFHSYDQAIEWYKNQNLDTIYPDSAAISMASYYQRDGVLLIYFVSKPDKGYIFENVLLNTWDEFKNAPSKGSYFNEHIKGRYIYRLSGTN